MQTIRNIFILAFLLIIILAFGRVQGRKGNTVVEGVVLSTSNGKPVMNVHVYIVHGEEEALTNSKGQFRIETSKKFPLTLYAEHKDYREFRVVIPIAGQKQVIKLQPR